MTNQNIVSQFFTNILENIVGFMEKILFFEVFNFPILVIWLVAGGIFFTLRMKFINITMLKHSIDVIRGKYSTKKDIGEVTHFQALTAAVSATVGLGNIAGVAVAVSIGGPGAVIWMMIAGFFGMSAKFAEVMLGHKYRKIAKDGKISGGAFYYLKDGLAEKNLPTLGKILAIIFAIFCVGGALGAGNLFQSNQTIAILSDSFNFTNTQDHIAGLTLALTVGVVLIGGIKRIAKVASKVVPFMALSYLIAAFVVIFANFSKIPEAVILMFNDAFTGAAVGGGMIGAVINGFKRAAFSNEAGLGSAPIAHAAAKTNEPVRCGIVALLEPMIDTMIICFITGLVITITGVYENGSGASGVLLTSSAFETVAPWFGKVLSIAVLLFAFSTMITWSYYGERAFRFLIGEKFSKYSSKLFYVIFCIIVYLGAVQDNISLIVDFSDLLLLSMAIPNLLGLYIMNKEIKEELEIYILKLKKGLFIKS